jgi:hypothetical protein
MASVVLRIPWYRLVSYIRVVAWAPTFTGSGHGTWPWFTQRHTPIHDYSNNPPQPGQGTMCRLSQKSLNRLEGRPFVKTSANCSADGTYRTLISPRKTFSLTKWRSISMCLVLWWCTGLLDRYWALTLSQNTMVDRCGTRWSSLSNWRSQTHSATAFATPRYSASALDLEIVACHLDDHDIKLAPKKTQYPEVDRLVSGHPAQSASEYATISKFADLWIIRPCFVVPLIYRNILFSSWKWASVGEWIKRQTSALHNWCQVV